MNIKHQQGSTLIIVLVVLLLITIVGTIAMRGSMLGLRLSTSSQISNILVESSDAAIFNLQDPTKVTARLTAQQMYGHFDVAGNTEDELVFCYLRNQANIFAVNRSSVIGSSKLGTRGYCRANDFATGRDAVVSQVYLRKVIGGASSSGNTFSNMQEGSSVGGGSTSYANMKTMAATVVSIMPTFSSVTQQQIQDCFRRTAMTTVADNVAACFRNLNVPYNVQYAEYQVGTDLENSNLAARRASLAGTTGSSSNATNP
ncbi:PilX N-terminal domain-containing pilus assembly protein [Moraxella sp. ZY210820]|uniref:PilX N-terminal domain-containing pilus assembly protein n=1 Tax=unclassified Moraxella TaxID=2685852 RepID=UPI0027318D93|nr:PilX N-terminal domain-containing pilus assembly protein [Moraxella sp. ZY210820]WLF83589.1 pilus assembly protein PilX [Moraxella sp. ZY210820]